MKFKITKEHQAVNRTLDFLQSDESKFEMTMASETILMSCDMFWQAYDRDTKPNQGKQNCGFGQYGPLEKIFRRGCQRDHKRVDYELKFTSYEHPLISPNGPFTKGSSSFLVYLDLLKVNGLK